MGIQTSSVTSRPHSALLIVLTFFVCVLSADWLLLFFFASSNFLKQLLSVSGHLILQPRLSARSSSFFPLKAKSHSFPLISPSKMPQSPEISTQILDMFNFFGKSFKFLYFWVVFVDVTLYLCAWKHVVVALLLFIHFLHW